jgi:hypothetical protein
MKKSSLKIQKDVYPSDNKFMYSCRLIIGLLQIKSIISEGCLSIFIRLYTHLHEDHHSQFCYVSYFDSIKIRALELNYLLYKR